jgi:methyl acetate hydrolase
MESCEATVDVSKIDSALRRATDDGRVPGVVGIVWAGGGVAFRGGHGSRNLDRGIRMEPDAIFRIASFTKAVVAIAVLQLVEAGNLDLDSPVGSIIPAFDDVQVLKGFDGGIPVLRPPRRRATVRHLMTHTSGLSYDAFSADLLRFGQVTGIPMPASGLKSSFRSPMLFDPGERWAYGMSTDWTGQVVEAVTGEPLDVYCRDSIFGPLGLRDIDFGPLPSQQERLAPVHLRQANGSFEVIEFEYPPRPEFYSGGHGLYSTADDFLAIQLLLLHGGQTGGVRLLSQESVAMMLRDQLGGIRMERMPTARPDFTYDLYAGQGVTWGLDIMITSEGMPGLRPTGSAGWCGTFNTFHWLDPANDLAAALYMQYLPLFDPAAMDLADEFERAIYTSVSKP